MVTDVSAMFVDKMHFRTPIGAKSNTSKIQGKYQIKPQKNFFENPITLWAHFLLFLHRKCAVQDENDPSFGEVRVLLARIGHNGDLGDSVQEHQHIASEKV